MPKKKQKQKSSAKRVRFIFGLVLMVAAVGAAGIGVWLFLEDTPAEETEESAAGSDYEDVMNTYYAAILSGDGASLANCMAPQAYWDYYMETYNKTEDDIIATYDDACVNTLSGWEETYGSDITLSYKITATSEPDAEGIEEWNENVELDAMIISDAITLEIELSINGSTSGNVVVYYPTLVQMEDGWYIMEEDSETLQAG